MHTLGHFDQHGDVKTGIESPVHVTENLYYVKKILAFSGGHVSISRLPVDRLT